MQSLPEAFSSEPSKELLEAQAQLLRLRASLGIEAKASAPSLPPAEPAATINWAQINAQIELQRRRRQEGIESVSPPPAALAWPAPLSPALVAASKPAAPVLLVQPGILLAMLKKHLEASGRVYLLLRVIDEMGRGWLSISDIRRRLTDKDSPWRVCGWRRLRQLLRQGEGIFWYRDSRDILWLKGQHRIAYTLDIERLQGFPIELPVETLLGGIQAVRAAFYSSFHAGRKTAPISRERLTCVSGVPERTQLAYDRVAGVKRRRNLAIGERYTAGNAQERAWKQGRATFHFVDARGYQGRKNTEYVAWRLPNSYQATYQRRSRGSRKRLNRKLKDLFVQGITGNVEPDIERVFFANGALAAKSYNREPERDAYWPQRTDQPHRAALWGVIAGQ